LHDPRTIGAAIAQHAQRRPDAPALVATGYEPLSYAALWENVSRLATRLRQAGFGRDARIAVALPNGVEAALTIVAIASSAVAVPLDTQLTASEIEDRLKLLRVAAIIVPADGPSPARDAAIRLGLPVIAAATEGGGRLGLSLSVPSVGAPAAADSPEASAAAFILQTSGTTAEPKLIPYGQGNMVASAERVRSWFDIGPQDRCLSASPVCYAHGLQVTVFSPLITGGSAAFPASIRTLDVDEWLVRLRPTWYSAGPTLHRYMLDRTQAEPEAASRHSLRFVVSGGAPLLANLREALAATLGVPVLEHYGSSEAAQIVSNRPPPAPYKPGTCGIPDPGVIRIMAADGREAAAGERGEIWVGGPTVVPGYIDNPELNRLAFVDGWFRSGDIGSIDADGFLTLHGRETGLINRGGEKVSPEEVDTALLEHPDVTEAAAFAVPHPRLGEDVAAAVVLKDGAMQTALDLRKFLLAKLAPFKIPRRIVFVDGLPKGTTGKVQRQRLVEFLK
jgi:acyl-CoA synthetase (AMP-forming)/AMP-acid ligase II